MAEGTVRGWFVWHDLLTPNLAGAHEFYEKTLGWKKQTADGDPSYVMLAARSGPVGGTVESRSATPHWLPYISTADVDATIEAASRLDARVTTPATALPNGGRYAVYHDLPSWRGFVTSAGFTEIEHYYRPHGLPRAQQPWLATVWRAAPTRSNR